MSVYFIQAGTSGPVKIGCAGDAARRLIELQVGHPETLVFLGQLDGGHAVERVIHRKFSHLRIRGEWFSPACELLEFVRRPTIDPANLPDFSAPDPTETPADAVNALLLVAKVYSAAMKRSLRLVGEDAVGNHKFFHSIGDGTSCTVRMLELAMAWFDENWPADLAWPDGVRRGLPILRSDAA